MKRSCKKYKKGFTLVELLAVLVILAIISVITIPVVTNIIDKARKEAYKRSIEGYARAAELLVSEWSIDNPNKKFPETLDQNGIEIKGNKVTCSKFLIDELGKVTLRGCYTEKSKIKNPGLLYKYKDGVVSIDEYKSYALNQKVVYKGFDYYVIDPSDKSQDYVTLLRDKPFSVEEINKCGIGHINKYVSGTPGEVKDKYGYGAVAYYTSENCGYVDGEYISTGCSANYDSSDIKYILDFWATQYTEDLKEVNNYKARLISVEDLKKNYGFTENEDGNIVSPSTLHPNLYVIPNAECSSNVCNYHSFWTMSQYKYNGQINNNKVFVVYGGSYNRWLTSSTIYESTGFSVYYVTYNLIRPVINLYKDALE